jgi:hypothetical protein
MMLLPALILYAIAGVLGLWSASLAWRAWHASRLQRRARREKQSVNLAITRGKRRLGLAIALVCLPVSGAVFSFGDSIRREADSSGEDLVAFGIRALVAVLFVMGAGAVYIAFRFDPSHGRRRCSRCWYDMSGTEGLRCPECGRDAPNENSLQRTRRAPALLLIAAVIFGLAYATHLAPKVYENGWASAAPTTALIIGLPWWSENMLLHNDTSLRSRGADDELWKWQERLLEWRAERIITRSDDLHDIRVATTFLEYDPERPRKISAQTMLKWMRYTCLPIGAGDNSGFNAAALPDWYLVPEELDPSTAATAREIVGSGLGSTEVQYRKNGVVWTRSIPSLARPHLPRLVEMMKDPKEDATTRLLAMYAMQSIADTNDEAWGAIRWAAVDSGEQRLARTAYSTMRQMAGRHEEVLGALVTGMDDPVDRVAGFAATSYLDKSLSPCDQSERLMELMERRPGIAPFVVSRLAELCMSERLVLCLERLLQSGDAQAQETAAWVASQTGGDGARLLPVLRGFSIYKGANDARWANAQDSITAIETALRTSEPGPDSKGDRP